jgi:hypothetical protein
MYVISCDQNYGKTAFRKIIDVVHCKCTMTVRIFFYLKEKSSKKTNTLMNTQTGDMKYNIGNRIWLCMYAAFKEKRL